MHLKFERCKVHLHGWQGLLDALNKRCRQLGRQVVGGDVFLWELREGPVRAKILSLGRRALRPG